MTTYLVCRRVVNQLIDIKMSLENYLAKSNVTYQEILWGFDREQVQQLYNLLKNLGLEKYFAFVREHQQDILKYISLSPSQRSQKKWVNHPDNMLIRFAALQISSSTVSFLDDIHEVIWIVDGGSYRDFHTVIASGLMPLMMSFQFRSFPFDGFESPFLLKP